MIILLKVHRAHVKLCPHENERDNTLVEKPEDELEEEISVDNLTAAGVNFENLRIAKTKLLTRKLLVPESDLPGTH